jgi:hypothetical protein
MLAVIDSNDGKACLAVFDSNRINEGVDSKHSKSSKDTIACKDSNDSKDSRVGL